MFELTHLYFMSMFYSIVFCFNLFETNVVYNIFLEQKTYGELFSKYFTCVSAMNLKYFG